MILPVGGAPYVVPPKSPDDYDAASPAIQGLLDKGARFVAVSGLGLLAPGDTGQLNDGGPSAARTALAYAKGKDEMYVFQGGSYTPDQIQDLFRGSGQRHRGAARRWRLVGDRAAPRHRRHVERRRVAEGQLRYAPGALRLPRARAAQLARLQLTRDAEADAPGGLGLGGGFRRLEMCAAASGFGDGGRGSPPGRTGPPATAAQTFVTGSFASAARGGVETKWAIARPPGQSAALRPVIALHGKGGERRRR